MTRIGIKPSVNILSVPENSTAVITGGASGIGYAIAKRLNGLGARVVVMDVEADALESAVARLRKEGSGSSLDGMLVDVADSDSVHRAASKIRDRYGRIDYLVSNAGVADTSSLDIWEMSLSTWEWIFRVNVFGLVNCLTAFIPIMNRQAGSSHVVVTASELGLITDTDSAAYSASKHAVVRISEGLYLQLKRARSLIAVTLLCPGLTATNIWNSERNRPGALSEQSSEARASGSSVDVDRILSAMDPELVVDALMDAIREDRFYCITAPGIDSGISRRYADLLNRANPALYPVGAYCGLCARIRPESCVRCEPGSSR